MNAGKCLAVAATIWMSGLASGPGHAQQSTSQPSSQPSGARSPGPDTPNTLTGGAEGTTTDKGTPGPGVGAQGSSSGSSGTAGAMGGGTDGKPVEPGTAVQPTMPSKDTEGVVRPAKAREDNK